MQRNSSHTLDVFITIDTEFYPLWPDWRTAGFSRDIQRDIYGITPRGSFGVSYQLEILARHRLKACFFVEGLCGSAAGEQTLHKIVTEIQSAGQEVQLHLHPEWLQWMPNPPVAKNSRETIAEFSADEQKMLVALGRKNLLEAGANHLVAFRAGDFAANGHTLGALAANGILYDTSYNACYPRSLQDVPDLAGAIGPRQIPPLWEFPVTWWQDRFGNRRHAQVCSCSSAELTGALLTAWQHGWHSFVIVSHSFEMLKHRRKRVASPAPDSLVVRRFADLCGFLRDNSDRFQTRHFSEIDVPSIPRVQPATPLASPARRTAWRVLEQAYRRLA